MDGVKKQVHFTKTWPKIGWSETLKPSDLSLHECLEQNNRFDLDRYKQLLKSFSTGFTSTADGAANANRAAEIERKMLVKLDGQLVISTMEVKFKVRAQLLIKNIPEVS